MTASAPSSLDQLGSLMPRLLELYLWLGKNPGREKQWPDMAETPASKNLVAEVKPVLGEIDKAICLARATCDAVSMRVPSEFVSVAAWEMVRVRAVIAEIDALDDSDEGWYPDQMVHIKAGCVATLSHLHQFWVWTVEERRLAALPADASIPRLERRDDGSGKAHWVLHYLGTEQPFSLTRRGRLNGWFVEPKSLFPGYWEPPQRTATEAAEVMMRELVRQRDALISWSRETPHTLAETVLTGTIKEDEIGEDLRLTTYEMPDGSKVRVSVTWRFADAEEGDDPWGRTQVDLGWWRRGREEQAAAPAPTTPSTPQRAAYLDRLNSLLERVGRSHYGTVHPYIHDYAFFEHTTAEVAAEIDDLLVLLRDLQAANVLTPEQTRTYTVVVQGSGELLRDNVFQPGEGRRVRDEHASCANLVLICKRLFDVLFAVRGILRGSEPSPNAEA